MKTRTPSCLSSSEADDEETDTLIRQLTALLADTSTPAKRKTSIEKFFDEIAEALRASDHEFIRPVVSDDESEEFDVEEFFDQVIKQIPKSERKSIHKHDNQTSSEINAEIDAIEAGMDDLIEKSRLETKKDAYRKKIQLEIADPTHIYNCLLQRKGIEAQQKQDNKRIAQHLAHITTLVRRLKIWSPAKNQYNKILHDRTASNYEKVQRLVQAATEISTTNSQKKKGFFIDRLTRTANNIHAEIAGININDEWMQPVEVKRLK